MLGGLRGAGVRAPEDVLFAGYDESEVAGAMGVTTVRQPYESSGRAAAQVPLDVLVEPASSARLISHRPELVVRRTT